MNTKLTATGILLGALLTGAAQAQDRISIVGSSTVFPFSTTVAEHFGKATDFATPVVESTGSGGGLRLFCAGLGDNTPDIANASRRIKASEVALCAENGVTEITEVKIGYDGIVLANSREAVRFDLSLRDVFLALAANVPDGNGGTMPNPYETWDQVNPSLPATRIEVTYGTVTNSSVQILTGVQPGDQIITSSYTNFIDHKTVQLGGNE